VTWPAIAFSAATVLGLAILLQPRLVRLPMWRATVTPLASIIGSGFLVAAPILTHTAGHWAWLAMLGLCAAGFLFGTAIRYNIRHVEPLFTREPPRPVVSLELWSEAVLALAYFISVAFYLNLLSAFALRLGNVVDPQAIRVVASGVIVVLGAVGVWRGFGALEQIETIAVGIKLSVIAGLLCALTVAVGAPLRDGGVALATMTFGGSTEIRVLLGLVILVQGFETSRYLGSEYDADTRIKTMRMAQLLATVIYVGFILLVTPFSDGTLQQAGGETQILDTVARVSPFVASFIIVAALASQLSAAVADMSGSGGLLANALHGRVSMRAGIFLTALAALALTWLADIYEIISYASRAFALYYGLQCLLAAYVSARHSGAKQRWLAVMFLAAAALALAVLLLGVPAEGHAT